MERLNVLIRERDPDVFEGHNIFKFDLPYLAARAKRHKVKLAWGRDGTLLTSRPLAGADRREDDQLPQVRGARAAHHRHVPAAPALRRGHAGTGELRVEGRRAALRHRGRRHGRAIGDGGGRPDLSGGEGDSAGVDRGPGGVCAVLAGGRARDAGAGGFAQPLVLHHGTDLSVQLSRGDRARAGDPDQRAVPARVLPAAAFAERPAENRDVRGWVHGYFRDRRGARRVALRRGEPVPVGDAEIRHLPGGGQAGHLPRVAGGPAAVPARGEGADARRRAEVARVRAAQRLAERVQGDDQRVLRLPGFFAGALRRLRRGGPGDGNRAGPAQENGRVPERARARP